jgi:SAM-dependent methyltransferase
VAETHLDEWIASRYQFLWPELFEPALLDAAVDVLTDLAGSGDALEFGIGTGRIALPLSTRGVPLHGIELSPAMVTELQAQPQASRIGVTIGDFATTTVAGTFRIVYLVRNTITNLTTQDEQVECFCNAVRHLEPGGYFVLENYIPELRRLPPSETMQVFTATPVHVGIGEYNVATQIEVSRHWWLIDGNLRTFSSPHRYVWPSELDLMARIAGMTLCQRWGDWYRQPFTNESRAVGYPSIGAFACGSPRSLARKSKRAGVGLRGGLASGGDEGARPLFGGSAAAGLSGVRGLPRG